MLSLALPHGQYVPPRLTKGFRCLRVAFLISCDFWQPIILPALRGAPFRTAMPVPKTTIDEYRLSPPGKNKIGRPRKIFAMQPIAVPHLTHQLADDHLRTGVFGTDRLHDVPTLIWGTGIGHFRGVKCLSRENSLDLFHGRLQ